MDMTHLYPQATGSYECAGVHHGGVQPFLPALQQGPQGGGHLKVLPRPRCPLHGRLLLYCQVTYNSIPHDINLLICLACVRNPCNFLSPKEWIKVKDKCFTKKEKKTSLYIQWAKKVYSAAAKKEATSNYYILVIDAIEKRCFQHLTQHGKGCWLPKLQHFCGWFFLVEKSANPLWLNLNNFKKNIY